MPRLLSDLGPSRAWSGQFEPQNTPPKRPTSLGTVQGDIHDIGKNIVSIVLEGDGFEVRDLGREVQVIAVNGSHPLDLDEWVRIRQKFPDVAILGASVFVNGELENGTPADVEARVRENIAKLAPYGRFIVTPVCCMTWRVPLSNIFAVRDAVERHGRGPFPRG